MELTVSALMFAKIIASVGAVGIYAAICLWPVNDKPTSKGQVITWLVLSALGLALIWGGIKINFV